ncbi:MAG: hypothetical protein Q7R49_07030 [Candidatus Daviesbacteria bacterium]|nr:hypothetical protein [Candidatus Daviesbacteria bacterium]
MERLKPQLIKKSLLPVLGAAYALLNCACSPVDPRASTAAGFLREIQDKNPDRAMTWIAPDQKTQLIRGQVDFIIKALNGCKFDLNEHAFGLGDHFAVHDFEGSCGDGGIDQYGRKITYTSVRVRVTEQNSRYYVDPNGSQLNSPEELYAPPISTSLTK